MTIKPKVSEIEADEQKVLDMLDECYDDVKIGNLTFTPSQIIKDCDPVALRCMVADEPIRYVCDDCREEFDEYDEAIEHWNDTHQADLVA